MRLQRALRQAAKIDLVRPIIIYVKNWPRTREYLQIIFSLICRSDGKGSLFKSYRFIFGNYY